MTKYKILFTILTFLIIIFIVRWIYHDANFVKNNFMKYTGINDEFIVRTTYYDNYQSYIETVISNTHKRKMLSKFTFENTLVKLKGKVECSFISETPGYEYYIIEDGYGPYGYILFALEKEGNTLKVYEMYGN
jgi:hypothetical protein